jgi:hypothetical protein
MHIGAWDRVRTSFTMIPNIRQRQQGPVHLSFGFKVLNCETEMALPPIECVTKIIFRSRCRHLLNSTPIQNSRSNIHILSSSLQMCTASSLHARRDCSDLQLHQRTWIRANHSPMSEFVSLASQMTESLAARNPEWTP